MKRLFHSAKMGLMNKMLQQNEQKGCRLRFFKCEHKGEFTKTQMTESRYMKKGRKMRPYPRFGAADRT